MRCRTTGMWILTASISGLFALALTGSAAQEEAAQVPAPIPADAQRRSNPVEADPASLAEGRTLFASQCTMCHGGKGRGDGDLVGRLKLTVPDFTKAEWQQGWTDGGLFYAISEGHGRMPAQKKRDGVQRFDETTRWHLINFIRSLGS